MNVRVNAEQGALLHQLEIGDRHRRRCHTTRRRFSDRIVSHHRDDGEDAALTEAPRPWLGPDV